MPVELTPHYFPNCVPGAPWWKRVDPNQGRFTLAHTTAPTYRRTDGVQIETRETEQLCAQLTEIDKAHPMSHPGIRVGQLWRIYKPNGDVQENVLISQVPLLDTMLDYVHLQDFVTRYQYFAFGACWLSLSQLHLVFDPLQMLPVPSSPIPLREDVIRDLPHTVMLLADPHFPHLAPFVAYRKD